MSEGVLMSGRRLSRWAAHPLVFYLGIPLANAVLFALFRSGLAALMPVPEALFFWIALQVPSWLAATAFARVAHVVLRPWHPPLWLICTIGAVAQALVFSPVYRGFHRWAQDTLATSGRFDGHWPLPSFTIEYIATLVWTMAPGLAIFIGAHYFYDRVLGVPKFRYEKVRPGRPSTTVVAAVAADHDVRTLDAAAASLGAPTAPVPAEADTTAAGPAEGVQARVVHAAPAILRQSRLPDTATLYAVSAEEHYVQLFSDAGTDLVRYRFSDALDELADVPHGMQVHRSWWARVDRARHWHLRGRRLELEFDQGVRVPISLAFREAALLRAPADVRARARHYVRRSAADSTTARAGDGR